MSGLTKSANFHQKHSLNSAGERLSKESIGWTVLPESSPAYPYVMKQTKSPILDQVQFVTLWQSWKMFSSNEGLRGKLFSAASLSLLSLPVSTGTLALVENPAIDFIAIGMMSVGLLTGAISTAKLTKVNRLKHYLSKGKDYQIIASSSYDYSEGTAKRVRGERVSSYDEFVSDDMHYIVDSILFSKVKELLEIRGNNLSLDYRNTLFSRLSAYIDASIKFKVYRNGNQHLDKEYINQTHTALKSARESIIEYIDCEMNAVYAEYRDEIPDKILEAF